MNNLNPREEIVFLMRGFFSCPILTTLGKSGILDRFVKGPFRIQDISGIENYGVFSTVLNYLINVGLLKRKEAPDSTVYEPTELGKKVFTRYGSFVLLHSYRSFMVELESLLFEKNESRPRCDRLENVIGSGLTNGRKFFPKALNMLKNLDVQTIADIGCGDGDFLTRVLDLFPQAEVIASDISDISIKQTLANLHRRYPQTHIESVLTDAFKVENWASLLADKAKQNKGDIIASMWYLIHEISHRNEDRIVDFLYRIHQLCPRAQLIIGEITRIDEALLSKHRYSSIMPEILFFHDVSGQGVLSWEQYQSIRQRIPYDICGEALFDLIEDGDKKIPTGFVWHLKSRS